MNQWPESDNEKQCDNFIGISRKQNAIWIRGNKMDIKYCVKALLFLQTNE